jgi:hypothetical protein
MKMKGILGVVLLLAGFGLAGAVMADEDVLGPDGYVGHPSFELGVNGNPQGNTFVENLTYTNFSTTAMVKGSGNYNNDYLFLDLDFPLDRDFTLKCGGSYLINATGSSASQYTASNLTGSENGSTTYSYANTLSWSVSMRVYLR